jgi:hypothetical protein
MLKRLLLGLSIVSPLGCAGEIGEPSATVFASPALQTEVFRTPAGEPTPPWASEQPPNVTVSDSVVLSGHLKGRLHTVTLDNATTDNSGLAEVWDNGGGYLSLSVAALGSGGAGMMILSVEGGRSHPLFAEGSWSSQRAAAVAPALVSDSIAEGGYTRVSSCAGPALGNFPDEQEAVGYEMTLERDPEDPEARILIVTASFLTPDLSAETELTATIRLDAASLGL